MYRPEFTMAAGFACLVAPVLAVTSIGCQVDADLAPLGATRSGADGDEDHAQGGEGGAGGAVTITAEPPRQSCDACASISGFEGRCLPLRLPAVAAQNESLPQSTCSETHRCVPCYDPFTGVETGACGIACDTAPAHPPETFPTCCLTAGTDLGHCVPTEAVAPGQAQSFGQAACGAYDLCVPDVFGIGPYCPQAPAGSPIRTGELCTTSASAQALGGASAQGACLPTCMPMVADAPAGVGQEGCEAGHKCVPCEQGGSPTGACTPVAGCAGDS